MTGKNRKLALEEEMKRAEKAFRAAALLFRNGFISYAVSKLYYHVLYTVRALLI